MEMITIALNVNMHVPKIYIHCVALMSGYIIKTMQAE